MNKYNQKLEIKKIYAKNSKVRSRKIANNRKSKNSYLDTYINKFVRFPERYSWGYFNWEWENCDWYGVHRKGWNYHYFKENKQNKGIQQCTMVNCKKLNCWKSVGNVSDKDILSLCTDHYLEQIKTMSEIKKLDIIPDLSNIIMQYCE